MLDDGRYDAFVVDAELGDGGVYLIDLTILAGPHKGEVLQVQAEGLDGDLLDLLGTPATLTVADGQPDLQLER